VIRPAASSIAGVESIALAWVSKSHSDTAVTSPATNKSTVSMRFPELASAGGRSSIAMAGPEPDQPDGSLGASTTMSLRG
jgi:hypothetical protein